MNKKTAGFAFLGVCLVLAALLVTGTIAPILSGGIFAATLAAIGVLSRGFTKK
jgi:hypothetical protein